MKSFPTRALLTAFLLALVAVHPFPLPAQQDEQGNNQAEAGEGDLVEVQFPNSAIPVILLAYEDYTGKNVIRDVAVNDRTLTIQTSGEMTRAKAAEFIEKSFLLNGYALVPTSEPDQMKLIAFGEPAKNLSSEELPIYTTPFQLPEKEVVVTYIMTVDNISSEDAAEAFSEVVQLHPYGKIIPLKNSKAVIITENTPTIRTLINLRDHIDVSPVRSVDKAFPLLRADAEEVAEALVNILGLESQDGSGAGGNASRRASATNREARERNREREERVAPPPQVASSPGFRAEATALEPRVHAITRSNTVLVLASPADMVYIESIVHHLDAPAEDATFMRRRLNYLSVGSFLQIAGDTLRRGLESEEGGSGDQISGGDANQQGGRGLGQQQQQTGLDSGSGFGGRGGGRGRTSNLGSAGSEEDAPPQSVVIDKTLLVADNAQNVLIVSGPPEHLRVINLLLDEMDRRPDQIQISAVIGNLNLGDDFDLGFDFLRSLPASGGLETAGSFNSRLGAGAGILDVESLTDVANLLGPANAAGGLTAYGRINNTLDTFVSALESTNRFKILDRPTVYTINNKTAVIETGQRIAVPRSTLSTAGFDTGSDGRTITSNIDYEEVLLRIQVIPLINNDGHITLKIHQQNDNIIGSQTIGNDQIPTIGTQALGTTIMVADGGTALLGGLIAEEEQKSESGLPLFSNLPLVGRVFGSTSDSVSRQELLVFIQPKIIASESDYEKADQDMIDRVRLGAGAERFAENTQNNLEVFDSQEYNSPQKRINFFKRLFQKKEKRLGPDGQPLPLDGTDEPVPVIRAVPTESGR